MGYKNPVIAIKGVDHGDPAVLRYQGVYYLYHTGDTEIPVYYSTDLIQWEKCGVAIRAAKDPAHWAQIQLWAPEVIYENGTFYMYVAAAVKNADGTANDNIRRIGVATSHSPEGPFIWADQPLTEEWSIDAHPFKDEDGTYYMFYNVRNEYTRGPNGVIGCGNVVDKMLDMTTLSGNPALVVKPEYPWEGNKEQTWFWNEGPFVLKRNGLYYQMYSAGFFGDDTYGVYYATSDKVMGTGGMRDRSWRKWKGGKPILQSNHACLGPGHHVVVKGPNGIDDYVVYHGYEPGEQVRERRVRVGRMKWEGDHIWIEPPSLKECPLPSLPDFDGRGMADVKTLNKQLLCHQYTDYYFETYIKCNTLQSTIIGEAFQTTEANRIIWKMDCQQKVFKVEKTTEGSQSSIIAKQLDDGFRFDVFHKLTVKQEGHSFKIYLDDILACDIPLVDYTQRGFIQLNENGNILYKGTILTNLKE